MVSQLSINHRIKALVTSQVIRLLRSSCHYTATIEGVSQDSGIQQLYRKAGQGWGFPGGTSGKEHSCQCRRLKRGEFDPWIRRISWRRKWQPTPVLLPDKSHGERRLMGYSPWGCTEPDTAGAGQG